MKGPNAPWIDDEDLWLDGLKERAIVRLVQALQTRIELIKSGDLDQIALEIRSQIATSAVSGHTYEAADLHDLLMELVLARDR